MFLHCNHFKSAWIHIKPRHCGGSTIAVAALTQQPQYHSSVYLLNWIESLWIDSSAFIIIKYLRFSLKCMWSYLSINKAVITDYYNVRMYVTSRTTQPRFRWLFYKKKEKKPNRLWLIIIKQKSSTQHSYYNMIIL